MNVFRSRVTLRDRGVSDTFDLALRFVVVHKWSYLLVVLWTVPAATLLLVWLASAGGAWMAALACIGIGSATEGVWTILTSRLLFEDQVRVRRVFATAARELPSIIATRFVRLTMTLAFGMFFFLPAPWFLASSMFATEAAMLERASLVERFVRSNRVGSANTGQAWLAGLLLAILVYGSPFLGDTLARSIIGDLLQFQPPRPLVDTGGHWAAYASFLLASGVRATIRFFVYINLRTRREGWDIQTRFASLANQALSREAT